MPQFENSEESWKMQRNKWMKGFMRQYIMANPCVHLGTLRDQILWHTSIKLISHMSSICTSYFMQIILYKCRGHHSEKLLSTEWCFTKGRHSASYWKLKYLRIFSELVYLWHFELHNIMATIYWNFIILAHPSDWTFNPSQL